MLKNDQHKKMNQHNPEITLRPTTVADLNHLFVFQLDPDARHLAAFTPKDPTNKQAYLEKYTRILLDPTTNNQTLMVNNIIAGSIGKFIMEGHAEITYWLDKQYWGQGIATRALKKFLEEELTRPIFGRVAFDNFGSQKVLEKCGFIKVGSDKGFANARQMEIEEWIYTLS